MSESALLCLSDSLVEHAGALPREAVERLRSARSRRPSCRRSSVASSIGFPGCRRWPATDSDLLQALLLLQRRDPAVQRRIVKFLRCESLTALRAAAPRRAGATPAAGGSRAHHRAARPARLRARRQGAGPARRPDRGRHPRRQRPRADPARDRRCSAGSPTPFPSTLVVLACLDDMYERIRTQLEPVGHRPPRARSPRRSGSWPSVAGRRSRSMLVVRLEHLYEALDVSWRDDDPLFPFNADQLDELTNQRARDCLAFFHKYQEQCIAAGASWSTPPVGSHTADALSAAAAPGSRLRSGLERCPGRRRPPTGRRRRPATH